MLRRLQGGAAMMGAREARPPRGASAAALRPDASAPPLSPFRKPPPPSPYMPFAPPIPPPLSCDFRSKWKCLRVDIVDVGARVGVYASARPSPWVFAQPNWFCANFQCCILRCLCFVVSFISFELPSLFRCGCFASWVRR